jgi:hypothetical protein
MRNEIFPTHRRSKLQLSGDGPFQVLKKVNDNAYKLDILSEYNVNATFNISNLSLSDVGNDSRLNSFEETRNNENQPAIS